MLFFFFYLYGDHRDLHSFPTRRSSDLAPGAHARKRGAWLSGGRAACERRRVRPAPAERWTRDRIAEDRKSTRLNSSHVRISYAVFCLKKKIKPSVRNQSY